MGQDDIGRHFDQLCGVPAVLRSIGARPADIYPHVAADRPTRKRQRLQKRAEPGLESRIVRIFRQKQGDATHPLTLLRARRKRAQHRRPA
jgi:hypothetical protein